MNQANNPNNVKLANQLFKLRRMTLIINERN